MEQDNTFPELYCTAALSSKELSIEEKRVQTFNNHIEHITKLKTALGAQPAMTCGCGHGHSHSHQHSINANPEITTPLLNIDDSSDTDSHKHDHDHSHDHSHTQNYSAQKFIDHENQAQPEPPNTEIEEPDDWAVKIGKVGETITALGGVLVLGPLLDLMLQHNISNKPNSVLFDKNTDLEGSPIALLIALPLVSLAILGAPYCHAKLEIASRIRENFLSRASYAIELLEWGLKQKLEINNSALSDPDNIKFDFEKFALIKKSDIPALGTKQFFYLIGDLQQHFFEYVGLLVIGIFDNFNNPLIRYSVLAATLSAAAYACVPEWATCKNTLHFMNSFNQNKIVKDPEASSDANFATKFSAFAKIPALFYANLLSFQQMFFGNLPAALTLTTLVTLGNIITQYFINTNTQDVGEANTALSSTQHAEQHDYRTGWQKLSLFGKGLVATRALGTGNERSEPIVLITVAAMHWADMKLTPAAKAGLAFGLWTLGILTAYSEARNAAEHTSRSAYFYQPAEKNNSMLYKKLAP